VESFERVLWWLFGGSAGAATRARVLLAIREQPRNAQQLAQTLGVDYTTVRHHLRVLLKNGLVVTAGETYGRMYFLSPSMESHWEQLAVILERTGRGRAGGMGHGT
jgi:DNA-binding transcriptional ArsR family regulator